MDKGGQIYALLRIERKLAVDVPIAADTVMAVARADATMGGGPTVGDLLIAKEEEEAVHALCRQATSQHERIVALLDAMQSIDTAGSAITSLQNSHAELEKS